MKTQELKPMGCRKSSSKREVYSNTILPQETRKTLNRQPNFTPETTGETRTKKTSEVSKKKESIKIGAEINEKEMKQTIAKINKTKSWFFEKINNIDRPLARLIKRKRLKSTKLEMKQERLQQLRNTKDHESILSNYMPIRWTT